MWKLQLEKIFTKRRIFWLILIASFCIELTLLSHRLFAENQILSSIVLFVVSCFIGILPICFYPHLLSSDVYENKKFDWIYFRNIIVIGLVAYMFFCVIMCILLSTPIDFKYSDIIPTIQQQVERFLHGQKVYQPIKFDHYSYPSGYLPANWVPFVIAAIAKFDFRYIPPVLFYISLIGIITYFRKNKSDLNSICFFLIPYSLLVFIQYNTTIIAYSVEIIVATYYLLFLLFMNEKKYILIGLFISLCLLSRYTLILFLPLYFFVMWSDKDFKAIKHIGLSSLVFLLAFYILPFFITDPLVIINGFLSYSDSGLGEWKHMNEISGLPEHLTKGAGFAYLFYIMKGGTIAQKIKLMQVLLVLILFFFLVSMAYLYHKKKNKLNASTFLLGSFKIYLTLFFTFIHVPYMYLYTTPLMVSAGILFYLSTLKNPANQAIE